MRERHLRRSGEREKGKDAEGDARQGPHRKYIAASAQSKIVGESGAIQDI